MSRHRKPDDVEPDEIDFDALMAKPLWSAEDAARFLDMPLASLYKWRTMGEAPAAFRVGRHLRFKPADVFARLEARRDDAVCRAMSPSRAIPAGMGQAGADRNGRGRAAQGTGQAATRLRPPAQRAR